MRCKACNGTGKIRGYFYEKTDVNKWEKVWGDSPCHECNGTGKLEQTNEEWFATLTTKEKAEAISRLSCYHGNIYEIEKWLKQPHQEENEK